MLGALNYVANALMHVVHESSVKRPQIVDFIDRLAMQHTDGKHIVIVFDNASIHHLIGKKNQGVAFQSSAYPCLSDALQSRAQSNRNIVETGKIPLAEIYHLSKVKFTA